MKREEGVRLKGTPMDGEHRELTPMRSKIRNFRDLEVWQLGKNIVVAVYEATKEFPTEERFGLTSQMRRSGVFHPVEHR